jgi:hypothetical protein
MNDPSDACQRSGGAKRAFQNAEKVGFPETVLERFPTPKRWRAIRLFAPLTERLRQSVS